MNKQEYNNLIETTVAQQPGEKDALQTTREVLSNMGAVLPQGDLKQVSEGLATDDYMGWRKCTVKEAQEYANEGTAVVAVSKDKIALVAANEDEGKVAANSSAVMTLSDDISALAVADMAFYANSRAGTTVPTNNSGIHFEQSKQSKTVGWSGYCQVPSDCSIMMTNFVSSNPQVASIEYVSGIITTHKAGTTTITAITTDGYSASYTLDVTKLTKHEQTGATFKCIGPQGLLPIARYVILELRYDISAINGNMVKIDHIYAIAKTEIGNLPVDVDPPSVHVSSISLNSVELNTVRDYDYLINDDKTWYAIKANANQWVSLGTSVGTVASANLHGIPVPPYNVEINTQISL